MASVSKRYCARGPRCTQHEFLNEPAALRKSSNDCFCEPCRRKHAGGFAHSKRDRWMSEVAKTIEAVLAGGAKGPKFEATLWDLFDLDLHNGEIGKVSDRGEVLDRLAPKTLVKIRCWLEDNSERAIKDHGLPKWIGLRADVWANGLLKQLPLDTQLLPNKQRAGLPLQGVAVRLDGKKWDLMLPVHAALLERQRRFFSERNKAKILGITRRQLRGLLERMDRYGYALGAKMNSDVLEKIMRGEDRGPKPRP